MRVVIIVVIIAIIILALVINGLKSSETEEENYGLDDNQYREYVYKSVPKDFKPYLQQILNAVDEIKEMERRNSSELNQASYNAMVEIYNKANEFFVLYWITLCISFVGKCYKTRATNYKKFFCEM